MPISDNRNVIIEFEWVNEEGTEQYYVKHHLVDGIPTVSFSNDGEGWFNLPFAFFSEIVDEVNQQKNSQGRRPQPPKRTPFRTTVLPQSDGTTVVASQEELPQTGLPMPTIQRTVDENGTLEPMEVADIDPLESFAGLQALVTNKTATEKPKTARKQRQQKAEEEIISRPVIRGADEATARMMRGGANEAKAIRRA